MKEGVAEEIRRLVAVATDETRNPVDRDDAACRIPALQARRFTDAPWYAAFMEHVATHF